MPRKVTIMPEDVFYLSMEGGGGKGAVYLGAMAALAELKILVPTAPGSKEYAVSGISDAGGYFNRLAGISGASAGAITAALLASGHTTTDLFRFMTSGTLEAFYDPAIPRLVPDIVPDPSNSTGCKPPRTTNDFITRSLLTLVAHNPVWWGITLGVLKFLLDFGWIPTSLYGALRKDIRNHLAGLIQDFGLFSGCKARSVIDNMISEKARERQMGLGLPTKETKNMTFKTFLEIFNVDLVITGTNIITRESIYFSAKNTPEFRVADAVRISMSFPGAFKPINVPEDPRIEGVHPGVWVDGGVLNNNPMHAFDDPVTGSVEKSLLGLRIGIDKTNKAENIFSYIWSFITTIMSASENMQVRTREEKGRTIQMSERELSLLEFSPLKPILIDAVTSAASAVLEAFGRPSGQVVNDILARQWGMPPL